MKIIIVSIVVLSIVVMFFDSGDNETAMFFLLPYLFWVGYEMYRKGKSETEQQMDKYINVMNTQYRRSHYNDKEP